MIRVRHNSIDTNASINSITSMDSTFTESLKRPVKEKLMSLKDRFTNGNRSKREFCLTPKTSKKFTNSNADNDNDKFALPNDVSMVSCRKLMNSTMNSTALAESCEPDPADGQTAVNDTNMIASQQDNNKQPISTDVADNSNATITRPQPIPSASSNEHQKNSVPHIVKSDWFWYTIQKGIASEDEHKFNDYLDSLANTPGAERQDSIHFKHRKRKRFSILGGASGKRRSSTSDAGLSVSGSFLDCTNSPSMKYDSRGKPFLLIMTKCVAD